SGRFVHLSRKGEGPHPFITCGLPPMMTFQIPQRGRGRSRQALTRRVIEVLEERVLLADGIDPKAGPVMNGTVGIALTNQVVATYTITDSSGSPGTKWRAQINWGDNSANDKRVVPTGLPDASFQFLGTHTYTTAGTYTVTVMIAVPGSRKPNNNTVTTSAIIS